MVIGKSFTEDDGEIEMMNSSWSCSVEKIYQVRVQVEPVEEEVEGLGPSSPLHVVLHHVTEISSVKYYPR